MHAKALRDSRRLPLDCVEVAGLAQDAPALVDGLLIDVRRAELLRERQRLGEREQARQLLRRRSVQHVKHAVHRRPQDHIGWRDLRHTRIVRAKPH